jgi:hypothetical protein
MEYREVVNKFDRIVMQGVLEHLDEPFQELKWMMDNLLVPGGDVITSSPCFLNPRGIVWMTLDMLGAVMSKTDLHYLNPWDFSDFCHDNHLKMTWQSCDESWGVFEGMIDDFSKRIPLALKDGGLPVDYKKIDSFLNWMRANSNYCHLKVDDEEPIEPYGATAVYHITKGA